MSVTIITGWIAAISLFLMFGTCLAMPWTKRKIEECKGKECPVESLSKYHKPTVILTIIAVIVHIVISLVS